MMDHKENGMTQYFVQYRYTDILRITVPGLQHAQNRSNVNETTYRSMYYMTKAHGTLKWVSTTTTGNISPCVKTTSKAGYGETGDHTMDNQVTGMMKQSGSSGNEFDSEHRACVMSKENKLDCNRKMRDLIYYQVYDGLGLQNNHADLLDNL